MMKFTCFVVSLLCFNSTNAQQVFTVEVQQQPSEQKDYFVKFTGKWCSPCKQWDKVELPKLKALGYLVREIDVSEEPDEARKHKVSSVPVFLRADRKTRTVNKRWAAGYVTAENLVKVTVVNTSTVVNTPTSVIYNGRKGNSHESRETLIKHLLNDGIHRGRYTLLQLNNMSDSALDRAHNIDHNTFR